MRILEYKEFLDRSTRDSRTNPLNEKEFMQLLNDNCKNFSFDNDQLWRQKVNHGSEFGLFHNSERAGTIGQYNYKEFFDLRTKNPDYPVDRHSSLIGSTTELGAEYFGLNSNLFTIIPFDETEIVFAGAPDIGLWSKTNQEFRDDLFILTKYNKNFKVP